VIYVGDGAMATPPWVHWTERASDGSLRWCRASFPDDNDDS
jgi:hypothetical protein